MRFHSLAFLLLSLCIQRLWADPLPVPAFVKAQSSERYSVLAQPKYTLHKRVSLSLLYGQTVSEKYLQHYGGLLTVNAHLFDRLSFELMGGYFQIQENSLITAPGSGVRALLPATTPRAEPNLPDLIGMRWLISANALVAPFYGRLSVMSSFDVSLYLYVTFGVGIMGSVKREFADDTGLATVAQSQGIQPVGNMGLGAQLMITRRVALRLEFRDFVHASDLRIELSPQVVAEQRDYTHQLLGLLGVSLFLN